MVNVSGKVARTFDFNRFVSWVNVTRNVTTLLRNGTRVTSKQLVLTEHVVVLPSPRNATSLCAQLNALLATQQMDSLASFVLADSSKTAGYKMLQLVSSPAFAAKSMQFSVVRGYRNTTTSLFGFDNATSSAFQRVGLAFNTIDGEGQHC